MKILKPSYHKALKIKNRVLHGKPVFVLMYHRVHNDYDIQLSKLTVSVDTFESQLKYFKQRYDVMRLKNDWLPSRQAGVVLTFDDGYADNLINVLPLLEKYDIPATIFISTLNLNTDKEFWWDHLASDYNNVPDDFFIPGKNECVAKSEFSFRHLSSIVSKLKMEDKEHWLGEFEKCNNIVYVRRKAYRSLSHSELEVLANHRLIDIGIHTHHHYPLAELTFDEQRKELTLSMAKLDELVPNNCQFLALPHGSYCENIMQLANQMGIKGVMMANDTYSNARNKTSKKINRIIMPDLKEEGLVKYLKLYEY